jgi:4-hydroxy-3-methylbut-2-enyl diphosphate reductase
MHLTNFQSVAVWLSDAVWLGATAADTEKVDGRAVRRSLNATGRYVRQPTKDEKSQELMEQHGGCHCTHWNMLQSK